MNCRDYYCLVCRAALCHERLILVLKRADKVVADVINVVSAVYNLVYRLDEAWRAVLHVMYVEHQKSAALLVPHVVDWQINEEVVVGLAPLKERLASGYVVEEVRSVAPYCVCR